MSLFGEEVIFLEFEGPLLGPLICEILSGRTSRRTFLGILRRLDPSEWVSQWGSLGKGVAPVCRPWGGNPGKTLRVWGCHWSLKTLESFWQSGASRLVPMPL